MNKWVKRKWLRALKSGEYAKGRGTLCRIEVMGGQYCCLGVLAEEMVPEFFKPTAGRTRMAVMDANSLGDHYEEGFLPDDLAVLWDLPEYAQNTLANLNDSQATFDPVIKYIEDNL